MDNEKILMVSMVIVGVLGLMFAIWAMPHGETYLLFMAVLMGCTSLVLLVFSYIDATKRQIIKEIREMQNLADNTP